MLSIFIIMIMIVVLPRIAVPFSPRHTAASLRFFHLWSVPHLISVERTKQRRTKRSKKRSRGIRERKRTPHSTQPKSRTHSYEKPANKSYEPKNK